MLCLQMSGTFETCSETTEDTLALLHAWLGKKCARFAKHARNNDPNVRSLKAYLRSGEDEVMVSALCGIDPNVYCSFWYGPETHYNRGTPDIEVIKHWEEGRFDKSRIRATSVDLLCIKKEEGENIFYQRHFMPFRSCIEYISEISSLEEGEPPMEEAKPSRLDDSREAMHGRVEREAEGEEREAEGEEREAEAEEEREAGEGEEEEDIPEIERDGYLYTMDPDKLAAMLEPFRLKTAEVSSHISHISDISHISHREEE